MALKDWNKGIFLVLILAPVVFGLSGCNTYPENTEGKISDYFLDSMSVQKQFVVAQKNEDGVSRIERYSGYYIPNGTDTPNPKYTLRAYFYTGEEYEIYCYDNILEINDKQSNQIIEGVLPDEKLIPGVSGTYDIWSNYYVMEICK